MICHNARLIGGSLSSLFGTGLRAAFALALLAGCAGAPSRVALSGAGPNGGGGADASEQRAASARVQAVRARARARSKRVAGPGLLNEAQLRVRGLSADPGEQARVGLRMDLNNPLERGPEQRARSFGVEEGRAEAGRASLREQVVQCRRERDLAVAQRRLRQATDLEDLVAGLESWTRDWDAARNSDGLEVSRARLQVAQLRADRDREAGATRPESLNFRYRLPSLEVVTGALRGTGEAETVKLLRGQPEWARRVARAQRFVSLAEREDRSRLPTLDFVEFDYAQDPDRSAADRFELRFALSVPLDGQAAQRAEEYRLLAQAEELDAQAVADELRVMADRALAQLRNYDARRQSLRELLQVTTAAEKRARHWVKVRWEDPGAVVRLVDDLLDARRTVLAARGKAADAACRLLAATGRRIEDWPREGAAD